MGPLFPLASVSSCQDPGAWSQMSLCRPLDGERVGKGSRGTRCRARLPGPPQWADAPLPGQTEPNSPTRWSGLCPSRRNPRPHPPRPPRSSGPPALTHRDPQGAPGQPPTLRMDQGRQRVTAQAGTRPWEARVGALGNLNGWSHGQKARSISAPLYLQAPAAGPTDRLQSSQAGPSNLGHPTPRPKRLRPQFCGLLGLLRPLNTPQGGTPRPNRSGGGWVESQGCS